MRRFTKHAREQMEDRNITEADVYSALAKPVGQGVPDFEIDTVEVRGFDESGNVLCVVIDIRDGGVVTAYRER